MLKTGGYIVRLNKDREDSFKRNQYSLFAEPVPEFKHSRNNPLICFIIDSSEKLISISLGKRGTRAGTDLRRLNLEKIYNLKKPIATATIKAKSPPPFTKKISEKIDIGGLIPPKSFQSLISTISQLAPDASSMLAKFSVARALRIQSLPKAVQNSLAEQKEAVATALTIAGHKREVLQGWDTDSKSSPTSFLDGIEKIRLREDPMVINDLNNLPGYETLKSTPHTSVLFSNEKSNLTVVLANRLPLEKQLGVDLIYYNETFSCFIMIQYKAMEEENFESVFRFPNAQLNEEIERMHSVLSELKKLPKDYEADSFRLSDNPFFLKICPRLVFQPDNIGLVKGMYLPLDYWNIISEHPSMAGPKGGKRLTYQNVRRYFDNTEFVNIASGGWIGTTISQSKHLGSAIKSTLESGRAVVFAVNVLTQNRHSTD